MDRAGPFYSSFELNGTIQPPLPLWRSVTYGPMSKPWGHQLFIIPGAELEFGRIRRLDGRSTLSLYAANFDLFGHFNLEVTPA